MSSTKNLQVIPGVGKSLAQDLVDIGIKEVADLKNVNPQTLYENLTVLRGQHIDRCVLYVFRCAVYFASEDQHDPDLLKWWNWKDTKRGKREPRKKASY